MALQCFYAVVWLFGRKWLPLSLFFQLKTSLTGDFFLSKVPLGYPYDGVIGDR